MRIFYLIGLVCLVARASLVYAAPVADMTDCFLDSQCFARVSGLQVADQIYDVEFVEGTFAETYPYPSQITFWNDQAGLVAAHTALFQLANELGVWGACVWPICGTPRTAYEFREEETVGITTTVLWTVPLEFRFWSMSIFEGTTVWANFERVQEVPESGTLGLLGLGLIGVSLTRPKKSK
jgi:hypothetical protein